MDRHQFENLQAQVADLSERVARMQEHPLVREGVLGLSPGDTRGVRQAMAAKAVEAATRLVDALYELLKLKDQRVKFDFDFLDSDFVGVSNLSQLDAAKVGTLFDFVIPSLKANFDDTANGGRNAQILLQVRAG